MPRSYSATVTNDLDDTTSSNYGTQQITAANATFTTGDLLFGIIPTQGLLLFRNPGIPAKARILSATLEMSLAATATGATCPLTVVGLNNHQDNPTGRGFKSGAHNDLWWPSNGGELSSWELLDGATSRQASAAAGGTFDIALRSAFNTTTNTPILDRPAQAFTASSSYDFDRIRFIGKRNGLADGTRTARLLIRQAYDATASNPSAGSVYPVPNPAGTIIATSNTQVVGTWSTSDALRTFTFPSTVSLTSGVTYTFEWDWVNVSPTALSGNHNRVRATRNDGNQGGLSIFSAGTGFQYSGLFSNQAQYTYASNHSTAESWAPTVAWNVPTGTSGDRLSSPDLASLIQGLVDAAHYAEGDHIALGLKFGGGTTLRTWTAAPGATGPELTVTWRRKQGSIV